MDAVWKAKYKEAEKVLGIGKIKKNTVGKIVLNQNLENELQENLKACKAIYNRSYQGQSSIVMPLPNPEMTLIKKEK